MILRTARGGQVEVRGYQGARADFSSTAEIPSPGSIGVGAAGEPVDLQRTLGISAAYQAIRMRSELVAIPPMQVFERASDTDRRLAHGSWQYKLLHERPAETLTPFDFYSAIEASLAGYGNAYVLKSKARGEVQELIVLNAGQVKVKPGKYYGDEPVFEIWSGGHRDELSRSDVIHIKGFSFDGVTGLSPIALERDALSSALAMNLYGAKFFSNDATPGGVIQSPEGSGTAKRKEVKEAWRAAHEGTRNSFGTAVLPPGYEFKAIGMSLADAQWIEGQNANVRTCARIFSLPAWLLEDPESALQQSNEDAMIRLSQVYLSPSWRRLQDAFRHDADLFGRDSLLYPEVLTAAVTGANLTARFGSYLKARQAGWMTANEIRSRENLPAIEGGNELQLTPVGGAPNAAGPNDTQRIEDLEDKIDAE